MTQQLPRHHLRRTDKDSPGTDDERDDTSSEEDREEPESAPPPTPPSSSEDSDDEHETREPCDEEEGVRRFAAIENLEQLERTIEWVKSLTIQETITIETLLIRAMRITGRSPGPGMYGWTRCYRATQTARALTLHMKNLHGTRNRNLRWQEQI